jgi:hypothetical protein
MGLHEILAGPVNEDSLHFVFNSARQPENLRIKEDGVLCAFPHSMQTPEFYGLSKLSSFALVGLVGRLKSITIDDHETFVPQPLEGNDAQAFESIVGISPDEMDRILKNHKTR